MEYTVDNSAAPATEPQFRAHPCKLEHRANNHTATSVDGRNESPKRRSTGGSSEPSSTDSQNDGQAHASFSDPVIFGRYVTDRLQSLQNSVKRRMLEIRIQEEIIKVEKDLFGSEI